MFLSTAQLAAEYTNIRGRHLFGMMWEDLDRNTLLLFHVILFHMTTHIRNNIKSYFSQVDGDPFILSVGMSRRQFLRIYQSFRLYDPQVAKEKGLSNCSNPSCYDSQYRFRPVWTEAFVNFQRMRNPPQSLSYDEVMKKYTGRCSLTVVLTRKPDPRGIKNDTLCEPNGYAYNSMVASTDPVPYDDKRGRNIAVLWHLLNSHNLDGRGKNYANENRTV